MVRLAETDPISDLIQEGDRVLLHLDSRKTWLVQAFRDSQKFHTHAGIIEVGGLVGKRFGDTVATTLNEKIALLRPSTVDFIMKSVRRTQIIYPKDFAYISARSGIHYGSRVLECGTGSGALTTYFASIVAPLGEVHTYEQRSDFFEIAQRNVKKAGYVDSVKFANASLSDVTLRESFFDLAVLDTGDPWTQLDIVHGALRGSGFLFCICPTTNQLENVMTSMEGRFSDLESVEIMLRKIEARQGKTRPSMRMVGHTCYIGSGRKLYD